MNQTTAQKILETNATTYNLIARDFSLTRQNIWPEMNLLVKKYVKTGDRVLDLGCGNGRLVNILPAVDYLGIDNNHDLILNSKFIIQNSSVKKINFFELDLLNLPKLTEQNFDICFMFASFNHLPSEELRLKVLTDIKNLLKPGGLLIMINWNLWNIFNKKNIWSNKFTNYKLRITDYQLSFKDVLTTWQSGNKKKCGQLYYRAFTLIELKKLLSKTIYQISENYYSLDGQKSSFFRAKNIVTVAQKQIR